MHKSRNDPKRDPIGVVAPSARLWGGFLAVLLFVVALTGCSELSPPGAPGVPDSMTMTLSPTPVESTPTATASPIWISDVNPSKTASAIAARTRTADAESAAAEASDTPSRQESGTPPGSVSVGAPGAHEPDDSSVQLVENGGFEVEGAWEIPITKHSAGYSDSVAHAGARSMRLGIVDAGTNVYSYSPARQMVSIPEDATVAALSVWAKGSSGSPTVLRRPERPLGRSLSAAVLSGDLQYLLVLNERGYWTDTLLWQRTNDSDWQRFEFDLLPFAGRTIQLHFGVYNDGKGTLSAMYVDDASLRVIATSLLRQRRLRALRCHRRRRPEQPRGPPRRPVRRL